MRRHLLLALTALLAVLLPGSALAQSTAGTGSPNLSLVKNIPYPAQFDDEVANYGTDLEPAIIGNRKYMFAGSEYNGLQIFSTENPGSPKRVGIYDCGILQGDVQVFKTPDGVKRTLLAYTADANSSKIDTQCFEEAEALGFDAVDEAEEEGRQGTFIVDVSVPSKPKTVSFIEVPQGSHNMTVHPSGQWLYNSNSDLITSIAPAIEIIDIRDPDNPVTHGELEFAPQPGLGTESHDITFSADGDRAYSAALSHGVIIDSSNPGSPEVISEFDDETINVWHQSDPVTLTADDGTKKEFLIVEDEAAGAAGGPFCPSGGVHIYDITGDKEITPEKVGYWNISDVGPTQDPESTCTAHVFDIHQKQQLMTIAFYDGGVRVVDLSKLADGGPMEEFAKFRSTNADTWAFKSRTISRTKTTYIYGNDIKRGFDVYKFDPSKAKSTTPGVWVPGPAVGGPGSGSAGGRSALDATDIAKAIARANGVKASKVAPVSLAGYRMNCLLGSQQ